MSKTPKTGVHTLSSSHRTTSLLAPSKSDGPIARDLREKLHLLSLEIHHFLICSFLPHSLHVLAKKMEKKLPFCLSHRHMSPYDWLRGFLIHSTNHFDFSFQWHHAMCQRGSHLEHNLIELELDTWHPMCHSKMRQVSHPTLVSSKNV